MNPAAVNDVDEADAKVSTTAANWPSLAVFQTPDGQNFMLRRPTWAIEAPPPAVTLPPRLAKIASLVIDGLGDRPLADAATWPALLKIVEERVTPQRRAMSRELARWP